MGTATSREREALRIIQRLGKTSAVAISRHMNIGSEYAALLCNSLARGGYVSGTPLAGYKLTPIGEELLQGDPVAGNPRMVAESEEDSRMPLAEKVEGMAEGLTLEEFDELFSELFTLREQLKEQQAKREVGFKCVVGSERQPNHWGKMSVFVVHDSDEEHVQKSKLVKELELSYEPQTARLGSWIRYTGRLPAGTKIKIFADGGDKDGRYRKYQGQQEWLFVLDPAAEELTFVGEYAGTFTAKMKPLGDCPLLRKRGEKSAAKGIKGLADKGNRPRAGPKSGWVWEYWE